jgi:hypothetical protein
MIPSDAIVIRTASHADEGVLRRLAALDEAPPIARPALLAEVDGVPRAALALASGRVVADPFARTTALVALLRLRAELLAGARLPAGASRLRVALRPRPRRAVDARA